MNKNVKSPLARAFCCDGLIYMNYYTVFYLPQYIVLVKVYVLKSL